MAKALILAAHFILALPSLEGVPTVTHRAFMNYTIGGEPAGTLVIGLFGDVVPATAANFAGLCHGDRKLPSGKPKRFAGSRMHRIIPGFMAQGGGGAGDSYFGGTFADENFRIKHNQRGRVSMANYGKNTNKAQFFITFKPQPHLNGRHVAFGQVEESSLPVLKKLEAVGTRPGRTKRPVVIAACGFLDDAGVAGAQHAKALISLAARRYRSGGSATTR